MRTKEYPEKSEINTINEMWLRSVTAYHAQNAFCTRQSEAVKSANHTIDEKITYYWQIVSMDNHGESTSGPVWSFTTKKKTGFPGSGPVLKPLQSGKMVQGPLPIPFKI